MISIRPSVGESRYNTDTTLIALMRFRSYIHVFEARVGSAQRMTVAIAQTTRNRGFGSVFSALDRIIIIIIIIIICAFH
jgi:hypothetical protein